MLIASRVIDKHSELSGLSSDDHSQYLHTTIQRTVTACHEFRSNGFGVPIVIKRTLGQTANLFNIYDDSYALLSYIDKDGNIAGTSFTGSVAGSNITGSISSSVLPAAIAYENESNLFTVGNQQITIDANTKKGLTIKAAALQGVSLLNIIDSNDTALFTVGAGGEILIRSSTLSNVFTIRNSLNTTYIRFDNTNDDTTPRGRLTLNSGSTNKLFLYTDGTDNFIRSDGDLKFNFNGNQRFIFDQSGNLTASGVYYGSGAGLTNINGSYIASGVVGSIYGGTNLSSYAIGDFIYASGVNALTTLSGNSTATQKVLRMVNGTPSWIDFTLSNLNDAATLNNYALLANTNNFTAQNTFAAGIIATSTPLNVTQTWNHGNVAFNSFLINIIDIASSGVSTFVDFQSSGVSKFRVDKTGSIYGNGSGITNIFPSQDGNDGKFLMTSGSMLYWNTATAGATSSIENIRVTFDGGGSTISGPAISYYKILENGTINDWTLLADQSGSIVMNVRKSTYNTFPTFTDITSGNMPYITSGVKNYDNALAGWYTSLTTNDILEFSINGVPSNITKLNYFMKVTK